MVVLAIEGIDGAGKSTTIRNMNKHLEGFNVLTSSRREDMLPDVRKILNGDIKNSIQARFLYYLVIDQIVSNEMSGSGDFILDRYLYSTKAYHFAYEKYYNGGANLDKLEEIYRASEKTLTKPDIAIFLYVDNAERLKRLSRRESSANNSMDYETTVLEYATDEFKMIASELRANGSVVVKEICTTNLTEEQVLSAIINTVNEFLPNRENMCAASTVNGLSAKKLKSDSSHV